MSKINLKQLSSNGTNGFVISDNNGNIKLGANYTQTINQIGQGVTAYNWGDNSTKGYSTTAWNRGGNNLTAETILGGSSGAFGLDIRTNNLTALKILSSPASAVNYLTFQSAVTSDRPIIATDGSGSNIPLIIKPKNTNSNAQLIIESGKVNTSVDKIILTADTALTDSVIHYISKGSSTGAGGHRFYIGGSTLALYIGNTGGVNITSVGYTYSFNGSFFTAPNFRTRVGGATTSSDYITHPISDNIITSTGTQTYRDLFISYTVNTTGGTSNIKGVVFNPYLISTIGCNIIFLESNLVASASSNYNIYFSGTALNYLAGNVGLGKLPTTAKLAIGGSVDYNVTTLTSTATTDDTMHVITLTSATPWTLTLHTPTTGRTLRLIKKDTTNTITVTGTWSSGYSNLSLSSKGVTNLIWDGSGWISY